MFTAAGEQVGFRTRKHLALLVRLALEPGKQFTRDYLADLLWPNFAPKLANHSLAQGLSVIKAKVAREAVVLRRSTVGLAAGWIDVDVNHLAANEVSIDGPFLDALEIESARPFEDWKDEYRARLIPQIRDCLVRQMDAARRIGDFPTVQKHAERLQDLDPLAEEAIRGIMEARAWASDRSGALKAFARFEAKLTEELGARPGADLVRMADLLRDGRRSPRRSAVPGYPPERSDRRFEPETLFGREREFGVLSDAWHDVRRKLTRVLVVTSDPGLGKTTLVNAFAASCQMEGAVVARAQAYDAERELPFAVLGELVRQLATQRAIGSADPEALSELTRICSDVVKAFPGVPKPIEWSPELTPLRIADAFLKTITSAAADNPVMLVIDDIHAADKASTAILHSVARKLAQTPILLVLAGRTNELRLSDGPWTLASDGSIESIRSMTIEPLASDAAEQLVCSIATSVDSRSKPPVNRILQASGGNPLAVELLTREWAAHGDASLLSDLEALDRKPQLTIGIPRAIAAVFERQTRRMSPQIRAALDLAAVLGRRLSDVSLYSAVGLTHGQAAEALSRLKDECFLREVSGDLEFRNELLRAQAYYSVAGATRQHLHRRVANLLTQNHAENDKAICLEIAWHHLRGNDVSQAGPFAIEGAEAVLAVGAPHGAQEILETILAHNHPATDLKRVRLLLAKSLLDQSKGAAAFTIIDELSKELNLNVRERAEIAMIRAVAEFQLNKESGGRYSEVAKAALHAARETGDANLVARALFECARAGTEEGLSDLLRAAEDGIDELARNVDIAELPMATLTKAFSRFSFGDPGEALRQLKRHLHITSARANSAELAFLHSGIGIATHFLGRTEEAIRSHMTALNLSKKVGDDARVSIIASNMCTVYMNRGDYEESVRYGVMSVNYGEASSSSGLLICYTNLIDPYMLLGNQEAALECLDRARKWLGPERRWKLRLTFFLEAASFALMRHNVALALDFISQMETVARGREDMVLVPGAYWKMRAFKMAHTGKTDEAYSTVCRQASTWKSKAVFHYLDVLAAKAWLEVRETGALGDGTRRELGIFDKLGLPGRKQLVTLQGFLPAGTESVPTGSMDGEPIVGWKPGPTSSSIRTSN